MELDIAPTQVGQMPHAEGTGDRFAFRPETVKFRSLPGKRVGDVLLALVGSLILSPVALLAAAAIRWETHGPVLFRQERLGVAGRRFTLLKFRSMRPDADAVLERILASDPDLRHEYHQFHKLREDPRVTRVGRWMRRLSLDEVPQLLNVLRGDMSLVGPRPYLPEEIDKLGEYAHEILAVRPGLTGLWQTSGRNRLPFSERVRLDAEYARTATLSGDFRLLAATLPTILIGEGAH